MRADTDVYITPRPGKEHLADRYWKQRGRLLTPNKPRLNTARLFAAVLDPPAVSSSWTPVRP